MLGSVVNSTSVSGSGVVWLSVSGSEGSEGGVTSLFKHPYFSNGYSWY